ncbi:hypothetical protein FDK12_03990 [Arthrobacter sp. NamB2]|uniref:DUF7793 family protein n=1 Tax=Arthrobacter sp. NamB2 TaxID=2576035 RepID=UPI0010C998ED|nr:hypothetical protein [Arthrobacter sp. NamB2]TKV28840.1 hypothetical protein FDK12_03990 [Arthrobacter sp. NamB2]
MMAYGDAVGGKASVSSIGRSLLRFAWVPDAEISVADARDVLARSAVLAANAPHAVLIDFRGIRYVSLDAHRAFATETTAVAAAFLGSGPMDRVLAARAEQALHPTRFFTSESRAIRWLRRYCP